MKLFSACLLLTLLCVPAKETHASGLIQKLPREGTWVRYHGSTKMDMQENLELSGTLMIRFVGSEMVEGEPCRWIEFEIAMQVKDQRNKVIFKMLIPEKLFQGDKTISKKYIRGWLKENDEESRKLKDIETFGPDAITGYLPEPAQKVKKIDQKKSVVYQRGTLEIDSAVSATIKEPPREDSDREIDNITTVQLWSHKDVPIGTAEARIEFESKAGNKVFTRGTTILTLEDFGTGAKSALPDHN